jgi:hypothetical protein
LVADLLPQLTSALDAVSAYIKRPFSI